jgi:hypothetical protein
VAGDSRIVGVQGGGLEIADAGDRLDLAVEQTARLRLQSLLMGAADFVAKCPGKPFDFNAFMTKDEAELLLETTTGRIAIIVRKW